MDKMWIIYGTNYGVIKHGIKSYADAEKQAKICAGGSSGTKYGDVGIFELIDYTQAPVPQIDVIKLS